MEFNFCYFRSRLSQKKEISQNGCGHLYYRMVLMKQKENKIHENRIVAEKQIFTHHKVYLLLFLNTLVLLRNEETVTSGEYELMSSNNYEIEFKFLIKFSNKFQDPH